MAHDKGVEHPREHRSDSGPPTAKAGTESPPVRLGRLSFAAHAEAVPDELLQRIGWRLMQRIGSAESAEDRNARIARQIVVAWPDTVRLTIDAAGALAVWRQPCPSPANGTEAFPGPADVEHALHVLAAVGIARDAALSDEIAGLLEDEGEFERIRALRDAQALAQVHFEAVAAALRAALRTAATGEGL